MSCFGLSHMQMQPITKNAGFVSGIIAIMLVQVPAASSGWIGMKLDVEHSVELTKVDLLSRPDWERRGVAVDGFVLGMTREEAFEVARLNNLKLRSGLLPKKMQEHQVPCRETSCSVSQINGNWIGVNLFFNSDLLTKIKVSVPVDAYAEVKEVNVSREFKGRTYQFFNNYSDDLRIQSRHDGQTGSPL
jgi:hypothetical protein